MKYVVCTKDFEKTDTDNPLARTGTINFYQFDLTRNNIIKVLTTLKTKAKHNNAIVAMEKSFLSRLEEWDRGGRAGPPPENIEDALPPRVSIASAEEMRGLIVAALSVPEIAQGYADVVEGTPSSRDAEALI